MRTKAFCDKNIFYLSSLYFFEERSYEQKLEMEEYLKNKDSKKFKEFLEWKDDMEVKIPNIRDVALGRAEVPTLSELNRNFDSSNSFLDKIRSFLKL